MRKRLTKVIEALIVFLLLGQSTSMASGWKGVKWGSNPNEVMSSSTKDVRKTTNSERRNQSWTSGGQRTMVAKLHASHETSGITFDAWFLFDKQSDALQCVNLVPRTEVNSGSLKQELIEVYGAPDSEGSIPFKDVTTWLENGTKIEFQDGGTGFRNIVYCERDSEF